MDANKLSETMVDTTNATNKADINRVNANLRLYLIELQCELQEKTQKL